MEQHILYIVSPDNMPNAEASMRRLGAKPIDDVTTNSTFTLSHRLLRHLNLRITLLDQVDELVEHLRTHPVDLLIYDERNGGKEAIDAVRSIKHDVRTLADQWGPDFYFPATRIIVILEKDPNNHRTFELGRQNVRDILVNPKGTALLLKWIWEVLYGGVIRENRVGVALSGGGIDGFLYQIGVLHALNEALLDRDLFEVDVVSGVSSGSLAGTVLASRIPIAEVIRSVHGISKTLPNLRAQTLFDFAASDISKRFVRESMSWKLNPSQWLANISRSIPTGLFKGEKLEGYLEDILQAAAQPNRFDALHTKLYIGATDQDSFEHIIFGEKGRNKMKITEACRASCAFPMFFAPKTILGRHYIDGQVTRSCNIDIVIHEGARLLFVIDPLKPATHYKAGALEAEGGYFGIVQVIKALCSTRFEADLNHISSQYPDVDVIVFQPNDECAELMSGSPMTYKIKTQLIEKAYRSTIKKLRDRYHVYQTKMARYGFHLCDELHLKSLENTFSEILNQTGEK